LQLFNGFCCKFATLYGSLVYVLTALFFVRPESSRLPAVGRGQRSLALRLNGRLQGGNDEMLFGLRWVKCWVKRTLKWRPAVFAAICSLSSAFDCLFLGRVEAATVAASAFFSIIDIYFIGAFWAFGLMTIALKRALYWCARNRAGLFAGFAFGLAFAVACGALDLGFLACAAICIPIAYFALGGLAEKHVWDMNRVVGSEYVEPATDGLQLKKRRIFDLSNANDMERLVRLCE